MHVRIAVLSARPGRVRDLIDVPFGRPRDPADVRADSRYAALREHIWDQLRPEVAVAGVDLQRVHLLVEFYDFSLTGRRQRAERLHHRLGMPTGRLVGRLHGRLLC